MLYDLLCVLLCKNVSITTNCPSTKVNNCWGLKQTKATSPDGEREREEQVAVVENMMER